ncbi:hypothetical protein SLEP1_g7985 [Rubroshorea leprosula]|uniref:Uncharacterized protein n=1 Tax=Rubroshorea leprosula TaxID=152421 RepID=A0AAV5I084_9ROSI|nr:hypothetical protein SLEP1_g7985 [Rubroshorea leprosula]
MGPVPPPFIELVPCPLFMGPVPPIHRRPFMGLIPLPIMEPVPLPFMGPVGSVPRLLMGSVRPPFIGPLPPRPLMGPQDIPLIRGVCPHHHTRWAIRGDHCLVRKNNHGPCCDVNNIGKAAGKWP